MKCNNPFGRSVRDEKEFFYIQKTLEEPLCLSEGFFFVFAFSVSMVRFEVTSHGNCHYRTRKNHGP